MSAVMRELPAECDIGHFETHFLLSTDVKTEIKNEPPEDIDDRHGDQDDDNDVDYKQHVTATTPLHKMPSIRLTPTMKLLATPNAIDPKRKFRCPYDNCTKSYGKSSHLRSHLTWHTGIKPYCCQQLGCGKSFTRSDELNRHFRTHTGEKPFECMQCAKKFSRSDHLTKHVATHAKQMKTLKRRAPDQPEQATTPNKRKTSAVATTTATTEQTTASSSTNKPLTEMALPPQGMSYDNGMHFMASLLEAAQLKHGRHVLEAENLTEETVMQHMPIKIKLERPLDSEQYKVVNETQVEQKEPAAAVEEDEDSDNQYDEDDVSTEEEDDVLPQPPQPTLDVAAAHAPPLPQAGAPLAVPRFDLVAAVSGVEEAQTIVPTKTDTDDFNPERPYRCTECIKCFKRPDDLNRHLRTHTGEKPYACTQCEKRFNRSDHLKKHLRTHNKLL